MRTLSDENDSKAKRDTREKAEKMIRKDLRKYITEYP
jgi:hypothetical protein